MTGRSDERGRPSGSTGSSDNPALSTGVQQHDIPQAGIITGVMEQATYIVPDMSCAHCERAVADELEAVAGVASVDVDLDTKQVTVRGETLDDATLRAAIERAGYEAA